MMKKLLTVLNLLAFIAIFGQTGIGTHTPEGALDITSPSKDWGLVLPHVDQAENTKNPTGKAVKKGTIVYDLEENCIRYFNGSEWSGCIVAPIPIKLECGSAVLNKNIIVNYPVATGTTVSIPYFNKEESISYDEITIQSKGVTGLKAVLSSGSIKKGAGNLVFSISGMPSAEGVAKFPLRIAGVDCEFVITVKYYTAIEVPAITNLSCDQKDQLSNTGLIGKHIINGQEVTVNYTFSNAYTYTTSLSHCDVTTIANSIWLGGRNSIGTILITFSRPVTNVGIAFTGADPGEVVAFTTNRKQAVELKKSGSCANYFSITDNKIKYTGNNVGGNLTVGGVWFTELKLEHNGAGDGAVFSFCLNSSDGL
ncbi:hypothetical protein LPB87_18235 [Flavobacterium sp. EDS]|uniref:hypothetical protein n=1 Tax=Flavobacterium sp. EDS TaxID=2897328 RepID=UPI001E31CC33|nr:hypothetical protein [Flavobacterium sp. EDS]MCD0476334.1 hypothetical protein [Flavobacterium sp. EDS]